MDSDNTNKKYIVALSLITLLSILFRFYNLGVIPGWDFDEGYNMRYSFDLLNGEILWFSIKYTFLPHPPLFFLAYALVIKYLGVGVYTIRLLTAFYGVATTLLLYFVGKEVFNPKVGLIASFIYAVTPEVVFWNRLGYANNQLILISTLAFYFIYRYSKTLDGRYLYLGCFSAGLSVITEYTGILNVAAIAVFLYIYHRENTFKAVVISLIPLALLFVFMLYHSPEYFLFDVNYQFNRFLSPLKISLGLFSLFFIFKLRRVISDFYRPIADSLNQDVLIYAVVISLTVFQVSESSFWDATTFLFATGVAGLCFVPSFLIEKEKERRLLLLFLLFNAMSMLILNRADHMTMVIYPFVSIAIASMLHTVYEKSVLEIPWILRRFKIKLPKKILFIASFYALFISLCFSTYIFVLGNNISSEHLGNDFAVAEYVNQRTSQEDLVLTYSWMFPLIHNARVSLLTQSMAYEEIPIAYYSGNFPKDRFAFNTSYTRAKFLIASNGTMEWILNETGSKEVVSYLESWDKTNVSGFLVYRNPKYPHNQS